MRLMLAAFVFCLAAFSSFAEEKDGWVSLFDGKTLAGWTQKNGTAKFTVVDGTIQGETNEGSPNSFLCTEKDYSDFELKFEVKVDNQLNSGCQIRSQSKPEFNNGRVHGPQVEISTDTYAGFVYGEGLKMGWISPEPKEKKGHKHFKNGEWNAYVIRAEGKNIKTWINGTQIADLVDDQSNMLSGFIGLQVHGIKKGTGPYTVQWRNIQIHELKK